MQNIKVTVDDDKWTLRVSPVRFSDGLATVQRRRRASCFSGCRTAYVDKEKGEFRADLIVTDTGHGIQDVVDILIELGIEKPIDRSCLRRLFGQLLQDQHEETSLPERCKRTGDYGELSAMPKKILSICQM